MGDGLQLKDLITAGLSIVAIVISIYTASQTWRYYSKPLLVVQKKTVGSGYTFDRGLQIHNPPEVDLILVNHGNAPARDLLVTFFASELKSPVERRAKVIEPGTIGQFRAPLGPDMRPLLVDGRIVQPDVPTWTVNRKYVLAIVWWRQGPAWWFIRMRTIRFDRDQYY